MNHKKRIILLLFVTLSVALIAAEEKDSQDGDRPAETTVIAAAKIQWIDGPASLPKGAQMVVLDGDPGKEGSFTMRLKMPAGDKIPPHTHPVAERVTVITGAVHLGIGERFEQSAGRQLNAGDFAVVPAGVPHFAWSPSEAVLQIHSEGPFQRKFVEPAP